MGTMDDWRQTEILHLTHIIEVDQAPMRLHSDPMQTGRSCSLRWPSAEIDWPL